jgi:probable O-glycosylation ligase (exosortase A-associated)
MGINSLLQLIGNVTFSQPLVMTALFVIFYLALGVLAFMRPVAAVVMYFGTSIMNPQASYPMFMDLPMAKTAAVLCLVVGILNSNKLSFRFPWLLLPMTCFLIMANIATFTAIHPELSDRRFEEFNKIGLMVLLTTWIVNDRKKYAFLFCGVLSSFAYDVLKNLVETQTKEVWVSIKGIAGWISDSNDWGLALAMCLPLFYAALALYWNRGWKVRIVLGAATAGALLTQTLTYSRGGFLAAAVSGIVFVLLDPKPQRSLLVAAAVLGVVVFYMPSSYVDKVETIFGLEGKAASAWDKNLDDTDEYTGAERAFYWRIAYEIMRDHPMSGIGWGNFINEFERRGHTGEGVVAHSTWFQVGAESGAISLFFYIVMIVSTLVSTFITLLKARRQNDTWVENHCRAIFSGMIAFCVGATFLSRENSELLFLYVVMSAVLGTFVAKNAAGRYETNSASPGVLHGSR